MEAVHSDRTVRPLGSILQIEGVTKRFGTYTAVHPLDLDIVSGEFVTLLGPSGCGKTTLLRMIAGLEVPSGGRLTSEGQDITRQRPEHRRFNMVFQSYALFPHLNVYDNVAYGLHASGENRHAIVEKVRNALEMVGLWAQRHQSVAELSGGMSQRVALVRAIVNEPRILLLDEPLAALDLQLRKRMQIELRSIQRRLGTTFILVTHDQEEALVMSDRIVVMRAGRVEQIGTPKDIYRRPQTRFVASFIGETSLVDCTVSGVGDGVVDVTFPNGAGHRFACHCEGAVRIGDRGSVSLRPEEIAVATPGQGLFNGTVTSAVFVGSVTKLKIDIGGENKLDVITQQDDNCAPGDRVGVSVAPTAGVFISDRGDGEQPAPQ